ncbi:Uu.00g026540.m01.CDS01 [Anthostomella pinea]|uniref:Uu.00g026540.m01.CDS01 n=1 Tax=Anthostomella pinea TaxID=933095 RepID=A0AAI8YCI6_9PEZI|nr:Uu.00g026540.m01.CDS01 [Anthostomella pinea]
MAIKASSFLGYTPITDRIFLRNEKAASDSDTTRSTSVDDPTAILIYGWGDGLPKHVAKYADGYHAMFPTARILVIISSTIAASSQLLKQRTDAMLPVIDTVFPTKADGSERVILHIMSNTGGIYSAATLNAYQQRHGKDSMLPHHLCVSDSTPGSVVFASEVGRWSRAIALGTAKWFPWPFAVTKAIWWTFLYTVHFLGMALRIEPSGIYSAKAFVNNSMATTRALRLYLYSKEDEIIYWEDLEAQAAIARKGGYTTVLEMFEGSPHVGHMRVHPEQYWEAIARCWKVSMESGDKMESVS